MLPSEQIELAIYRYVKAQGTERSTLIAPLVADIGSDMSLVIERLKGLHSEGYIKLSKYIVDVEPSAEVAEAVRAVVLSRGRSGHRIPYSEEGSIFFGPQDFFTQRDFIIEITPQGRRYFEGLENEENAEKPKEQTVTAASHKSRKVWVVYGRDHRLTEGTFTFLHAIGLEPVEFSEARKLTGKPLPYVREILEAAFANAQAVVVLLSPDDQARLRKNFVGADDPEYERILTGQARQNVIFEAGMALASHPERTVLVQFGNVRPFSDVSGLHIIRMDDSAGKRKELAQRLQDAGCPVDLRGDRWLTAGDLKPPSLPKPDNVGHPTPTAALVPNKREERGPNIVFLGARTIRLRVDGYQGVSFHEASEDTHLVGVVACFRNDAVYGKTIRSVHNARAHLKFIGSSGAEIRTGLSGICWLGHKVDLIDLVPGGESGCVVALLVNNGSIMVPWKHRTKDWMGDALSDRTLDLDSLPRTIEVSLLNDNNQLLLAPILLEIAYAGGKLQVAVKEQK